MELSQRIKQRLREVEDWNAVIDELEVEAGAASDAAAQSRALFDVARACEQIFLEKARAMQCYQRAFKLSQANVPALRHARQIYEQMAHLEMVSKLMGLEIKTNQDADIAARLNYDYGRAMLNLRQIDTARQFLEAASSAEPQNDEFQQRFQEILYDRGNWQFALENVYVQLRALTGEQDPLAAKVPNRGATLGALFLKAARILQQESPEDPRLLPLLFKALEADPTNDEASFVAELLLAQNNQFQHLQKLHERRASLISDEREKIELLRRLASIWHVRFNNPAVAASFYRQALELAYAAGTGIERGNDDASAWHVAAYRAVRLQAEQSGEADGLIPLAERGLAVIHDPIEMSLVALQAGEVAWRQFKDEDTARHFFARAAAAAPNHPSVREFIEKVGPLGEPRDTSAPAAKEPDNKKKGGKKAKQEEQSTRATAPTQAAQPAAAKPAAAAAAPEANADDEVVETGDEIFTADELQLLKKAQASAHKGGKFAIDAWREAMLKLPGKRLPAERLKGIYIEQGKWSNVAELLKEVLKHVPDEDIAGKERVTWELIELYRDQLKQPGLVVTTLATLEKLLEGQSDAERLLKVVEAQQEQFEQMKRWPDLIGRIRRRAELTEDPMRRTSLYLEAGNLFLEKFNNQAEAIKSFESVLEVDEYNQEALAKLKDLYGRRRDWEKLVGVEQKELGLIADASVRKAALLEIARTAGTKIKKPALSIELWTQLLDLDPDNAEALENLEQLQEREKDWSALARTLDRLVEVSNDAAKKSSYLVKLGLLYADKLENTTDAIRTWEALHELEPDNRRAQDALKKLYLQEGRMDSLEGFYARQDKWGEFVRVLEREAETKDGEQRTELALKIAELYATKMDKPDRATRTLEKALQDDPDNLTVAEKLIELYEQAGDERHLAGPLGIKLEHTRDSQQRQSLLRRLADLAERVQDDARLAFSYVRRTFEENHEADDIRLELQRLGEKASLHAELVEAFVRAINKLGASTASLPLRLKVAEVQEHKLHDLEAALQANQAVLEIDAEQADALASLERLYLALGREEDLLDVLNTKLTLASNDDDRRSIQTRIGSMHEQLGHAAAAIDAYNAVLASGVEDPHVLAALDRLYQSTGQPIELADILRRELELVDAGDRGGRAKLLSRLGALYQQELSDPATAVELFRQVLEIQPENREARTRLETWLDNAELKSEVARILLPVYQQAEAWPALVRCLEVQTEAAEDPYSRVELLLRMGAILSQQMGDSSRAFDAYSRAFREDPQADTAQQALENIAGLEDRWADLAALYEEAVTRDLPETLLRSLLQRLAGLYDSQLNQPKKAIACYQRAADLDPDNSTALDALEKLYRREEKWPELLEVYRRKVDVEPDPERRLALRFQIAYLQEEMLSLVDEAIQTYNEILGDDDSNARAIQALDRLYQQRESWSELAENLARQLAATTDRRTQVQLNLRLGELRLQKLEQPGLAVEIYSRVLELEPDNGVALAALESLLANEQQQLAIARILEPIYRNKNQWTKLISTYEIMVRHSLDPNEKIRLFHQIAELYEIAGDEPSRAFAAFGRALREDPGNQDTQTRLESLARQLGSYAELVALYEEVANDIVDDELRIQILGKVAQVYETALVDTDQAAATYDKILSIDPSHFAAVDALIEVHRRSNNFKELVTAVVRKSDMVDDPGDRKQLLLYAANVRETVMEDPAGATDLYQQVVTIDDGDAVALDALERLYIQMERWDTLKDIYQRKTELATDPEERRKVLYVLGQVYDAELKDVDRAIDTYQAILDIDPSDHQAIVALDRLYGQAARWLDQLQILERAVETADRREEQTSIRYRIGSLWEMQLNDMVRAIEAYREVLTYDGGHRPTIEALERIVHGENEPLLAAEVLEPLYRQLGEWERLVDIYGVLAKDAEDPVAQVERLHQIAGIFERQLNEFDKAFDAYAKAMSLDPQSVTTNQQLDRLAEVTGDWDKYARLLATHAEKVLDPHVKVEMLLRLARIHEDRLGQMDEAIRHYVEATEVDPDNESVIRALDRIFTAAQRWRDLVENLRRQIRITADERQLVELYFRMGQLYQFQMGDLPKAIDAYREILNINPAHEATLRALEAVFEEGHHQSEVAQILEPIYYAAQGWEAIVKLGEVKLASTEDTAERLTIIQGVAEICERKLADPAEAYIWWLRAYIDDPTNDQVSDEMERLADVTQEWGHIVSVGEQILEQGPSPEIRLAILNRSARILDQKLHDIPHAIETYRQVLEVDPENAAALKALDRIYSGADMAQDLAEIIQRRLRVTTDPDELVSLELRLAATLEQGASNPEQAILAYRRVLENDPQNREALERLELLYVGQYRWQELFDTYQKMADVASTDDDMAACYQRMAKLASDTLNRESDAIDYWTRVLDLRGEDPLALGELARLHERNQRWEELVEVLERQVYVIEDTAQKAAAYQTLGRVYGERLERDRNALDAWLNALELDERNAETLDALHRIYEQNQAWVELIEVLERTIALGPSALSNERLRDLHAQAGRIYGEYLMQSDRAIQAWHAVLELNPGDMDALRALEDLYTQDGRWNESIAVLEHKSNVLEDTEARIDVLMQIASIWEEKLEDSTQAAGAYMEILEIDPRHMSASEAVEHIFRQTEDWAALGELLISRAEVTEDKSAKVETLQAAAKVFEDHLGDLDMAFATLQAAFNEDYTNDHTARELERLATQANKWGELLNEYNGLVQQIEDPIAQSELWVKIGRWYGEHLQRPDYGIQSLERALQLNPEGVSALRELASFHRRAGNASELAATLARIVPLEAEPSEQVRVLLDLAEVQEANSQDPSEAIESYRRVLEIDSESSMALDALARLHEQQSQWQELVGVYARRAAITDDPDQALALKRRIGYVQETSLAEPAAAIETYRDILGQDPGDPEALAALERLYLASNQVTKYLEILEAELDATADVDEQIAIYDKMASALIEFAQDRDRAAEVLEKVIMLDPQRESTYRQLEQLYAGLERWTELVETYRSHIDAAADPAQKLELLATMGLIYEQRIEDVDRAIETYSEILSIDPQHFDAANTLSRLQEAIEDWPSAVETMGRLVDLTGDPQAKLELLTRLGRVLHQKLMDSDHAERRLSQALEIEPGHVPALILLADIYKERADWMKAARTLETASDHSSNPLEKTSLLAESAFIYYQELEDRQRAVDLFARTLQFDPEHVRVGQVLSTVYYDAEYYAEADPIFDMLTRKIDALELDDDGQRDLLLRAADVARRLGNSEKALKHFRKAYDIDSTNRDVLVGMADLLFAKEDWERAFKLYQTILVQHRDAQSDDDTVQVYYRLGTIKNRQGEPRKALNYFEKALEVQPHHQETLSAVIELQAHSGDWEGVIQAKRALIDVAEDGDAQFALYKDIGELYADRIGNRDKAAQAYESALEIRPDDYPLLHTLLDLYIAAKRWENAIGVLDRIVEIEQDPARRSRYNYTAAVLLRDELHAHDEAIDRFNMALDDDPGMLKAFQAIDTMVTQTKDWKTLERAYRKMLKRLPADGEDSLKLMLWSNLGEIYRTRLRQFKEASAAFEVAAKLDATNVGRHIILAELYEQLMLEQGPAAWVENAVREHQILIAHEPFRYESYNALYNIYRSANEQDKAFCVAMVLSFLKKATPEQEAYYEKFRRHEFQQARQRLSEETLRRHVFHPDEDLLLTGVLGLVAPAIASWRAVDLPNTIKAKERVDIATEPSLFSRLAKYVQSVLNVQQPDVYLRPNDPGDLTLLNTKREGAVHASMVVFQNLLRGKNEQHLAFALGRYMMDLYQPHYAYVALDRSHQALKQVFMACLKAVGMPVQGDAAAFDQIAREIVGRMPGGSFDQLRTLIKKFIDAGGSTDVKRWAAASELTGYRVGLLLCGDLVIAAQMISQEQSMLGSAMSPKDKIKELVLYGISEDYFAARRAIGMNV